MASMFSLTAMASKRTIGKGNTFAQMECVHATIGRNFPTFGKAGLTPSGVFTTSGKSTMFLRSHLTRAQVGINGVYP